MKLKKSLLALAAVIVALFALCHLAGGREQVSALFATARLSPARAILGGLYGLLYLLGVLVSPILIIAAAAYWAANRVLLRRGVRGLQ